MASAIRRAWPRPRSVSGSHGSWKKNMYQLSGKPCSRTTSGPSPSTAQWRWMPLVATVRCSRAIAGRHSEGATALSNRVTGLSLPRAGRIMIGMASRDRFLLCTPRFYRVEYVINPWMEGNVGRTDAEEAMRQWEALRAALAARAYLEQLEPAADLPDMPFTANAG